MGRSFSCWHRLWLLVGIGVAAFLTPAAARADDPVELLKKTLKEKRWREAEKETAKLRTLSELRRGYFFLSEWTRDLDPDPKKDGPQKAKLDELRSGIANKLVERIDPGALGDPDRKIAACILIAEIAEADQPDQRAPGGKFASRFTDILVGLLAKTKGSYREGVGVRQAALHALGKITPPPGKAMPVLTSVLNGNERGPQLLAAYALTDLVKNAPFLPRQDEMATMNAAVAEAARLLGERAQDEQIRGYCLQTIQTSARIFTEYHWTNRFDLKGEDRRSIIHFELLDKKLVLHADLQKLLKTHQDAMPAVLSCLAEEKSPPKIKLTALDALSQIVAARQELCEKLQEARDEKVVAAPLSRPALLAEFNAPDPIKPLLDGKWVVVPNLLQQSEDVRLKRGVMSLLERVARDVEKTQPRETTYLFVAAVAPALSDADRYVRWSAARTLGNISPQFMNGSVFEALGEMLVDPSDPARRAPTLRDPDLSAAAAATMEKLAEGPGAPKAVRFLSSAIEDPSMDSPNRIAAMKALVAIGAATPKSEDEKPLLRRQRQEEANKAFPQVISALSSDDAAVRREACMTLGLLGNPGRKDYYDDAIRALKKAMSDDDTEIRLNASEAILTITPPPR